MPSLEGAQEWLDRAEEHLQDLKAICNALAEAECDTMIASVRFDDTEGAPSWAYARPTAPVPARVSILTGEAVQAMRRSLDYLIYEIAWLDSGAKQEDTQFPIDDREDVFDRRGKRRSRRDHSCYLIGVSDEHAAAIKLLQPFKGVDWTKTLRAMSNPDKHRHLTMTRRESSSKIGWGSTKDATDHKITRTTHDSFTFLMNPDPSLPDTVHMKFHISVYVALEKGVRVIETLDQLKAEIADVLTDFHACFGGKCRH